MPTLAAVAALLAAATGLLVLALVVRRVALARSERARALLQERLRPLALAIVEGEDAGDSRSLTGPEAEALAGLLARLSRSLSGSAREHIAAFFERRGLVQRELARLGARRRWRRASAAHVLGDMASPVAIPGLLAALEDGERDVRAAAARSLALLGATAAVEPLVLALAEGTLPRAVTAQALLSIGAPARAPLHRLVGSPDASVRVTAIDVLGLLGDAGDGALVSERLRDGSAEVRAHACRALARLGAEEAAEELRAVLGDRVPFVRVVAANALGAIGDGAAAPALLRQAGEDGFAPARAAARALLRVAPSLLAEAAVLPGASTHLLEAADTAALREPR